MSKKITEAPMLQIGVAPETVRAIEQAVLKIINTRVGDVVLVAALETFQKATRVDHTTVSSCVFNQRPLS